MVRHAGFRKYFAHGEGHPATPLTSEHPTAVNDSAIPDPAQSLASVLHQSFLATNAKALSSLNNEEKIELLRGFARQGELEAELNKELCRTLGSALKEVHLAAKESEVSACDLGARHLDRTLAEDAFDLQSENESYEEDPGSRNRDPVVERWVTINLDQTDILQGWYKEQLWHMQQVPLKKICKAWIKKIHPRKSGKYPYNGGKRARNLNLQGTKRGDLTRPQWWPTKVPHEGPDHLDQWRR